MRLGHAPGPLHHQPYPQLRPHRDRPRQQRRRKRRAEARVASLAAEEAVRQLTPAQVADKPSTLPATKRDQATSTTQPAAEQAPPLWPPLLFKSVDTDYRENAEEASINATNNSVLDAAISTLTPHVARQDQYELKTDAQFTAIEDQLESLFDILKKKASFPQSTAKFPCNVCSVTFETERGLRNHTRTHQES